MQTKLVREIMRSYGVPSWDIFNNIHRSGNRSVKCYASSVQKDRIRYLLVDLKNALLVQHTQMQKLCRTLKGQQTKPFIKVYWRKPTREVGRYEAGTWGMGSIIVQLGP
jgi:hypothetical protein